MKYVLSCVDNALAKAQTNRIEYHTVRILLLLSSKARQTEYPTRITDGNRKLQPFIARSRGNLAADAL